LLEFKGFLLGVDSNDATARNDDKSAAVVVIIMTESNAFMSSYLI